MYAQGFAPDGEPNGDACKIDVDGVVELYEHYIIPLTREVEVSLAVIIWLVRTLTHATQVDYLLERLKNLSQGQIDELASRKNE